MQKKEIPITQRGDLTQEQWERSLKNNYAISEELSTRLERRWGKVVRD